MSVADMSSTEKAVRLQGDDRPLNYYTQHRPELASLVPDAARHILDVGCGEGHLGAGLRRADRHVCGIELIPAVAARAAGRLDEVICGDVETLDLPWLAGTFDVILCGDVLEHLGDPWQALRRLAVLLAPGGRVIASIPNVQNYRVIRNLIRGRWDYRERGILDVGHLRFFTADGIRRLFEQAGLRVIHQHAGWNRTWGRRLLSALTGGRCEAFLARYYAVVGVKSPLAE